MAKKKINNFAFEVSVVIDSDDDFRLSIQHSFVVTAPSIEMLSDKLITILSEAKLICSGVNSNRWFEIRDNAIQHIISGCFDFDYGGNQTISMKFAYNN